MLGLWRCLMQRVEAANSHENNNRHREYPALCPPSHIVPPQCCLQCLWTVYVMPHKLSGWFISLFAQPNGITGENQSHSIEFAETAQAQNTSLSLIRITT